MTSLWKLCLWQISILSQNKTKLPHGSVACVLSPFSFPQMSTPLEIATADFADSIRNLREAQDRLNAYMDNPANKPLNTEAQEYKVLKEEVDQYFRRNSEARQTFDDLTSNQIIN